MNQFIKRWWQEAWRDPVATGIALLGVMIGTGSVVFMVSVIEGASVAMARSAQQAEGANTLMIRPKPAAEADARVVLPVSHVDAERLLHRNASPAQSAVAAVSLRERRAQVGTRSMEVGLQGGGAAWAELAEMSLLHGRHLGPSDAGTRRCVIGYDVWTKLMDGTWPVREPFVVVDGVSVFEVVGVLARRPPMGGGSGGETWRIDRKILVDDRTLTLAIEAFPPEPAISVRFVETPKNPRNEAVSIQQYLTASHRGVVNFGISVLEEGMDLDAVISSALAVVAILGGGLTMVLGSVNVMNGQLVTVVEKGREYAIHRSLGMSARRLRRRVMVEVSVLCLFGSLIGVAVGLGGAWLVSLVLSVWVVHWPFVMVGWVIASSLGTSVAAGLVASWIPAKKASAQSVVEALR